MRILGMISGTSHDGIDCAIVDLHLDGDTLVASLAHRESRPYDAALRARIIAALPPSPTTFAEVCELDTLIGQAFARSATLAITAGGAVDAIVSHGQTVYHWVEGDRARGTLQLGQPAWIAEATGVPVLSDVRSRDIAAGGQGAPLASTVDVLLLAGRPGRAAALNLGGISNATVVADGEVGAWDIGPAGALTDAVVVDRDAHPSGFDLDGAIAASGTVDLELLEHLLDEPYYRLAPPKTTGKELFHLAYVEAALAAVGRRPSTPDLLATLTELTVRTIADALRDRAVDEVFVSGGGSHNPLIMAGLARELPQARIAVTDELGLPADDKEAVLMAVLGWSTLHGVAGSVADATGARGARLLGTITPGAHPLAMPDVVPAPRSLRMVP